MIEYGQQAAGKEAIEAQMILNHKAAIELLVDEADRIGFNTFTFLSLHGLLSENLLTDPQASGRLRLRPVEIGGSIYLPIAIPQVIEESFKTILIKANDIRDPFEQAFFIMVHIPYLQAFEDVNKRVSRLGANISLIKHNLCPLTFIDVPEQAYIEAYLGLYETTRVELLRDVFIWAYERSTREYLKVKNSLVEPDPLRIRYRDMLHTLIAYIVRERITHDLRSTVERKAKKQVDAADLTRFIDTVLDDLKYLHEGILARYRIQPKELIAWREKQKKKK